MCIQVPAGKVVTYKELARKLQTSPRAIGGAMRRNPYAPVVPCHRVVSATLELGGFQGSADPNSDSLKRKRELLLSEGVVIVDGRIADDCEFRFDDSENEKPKDRKKRSKVPK